MNKIGVYKITNIRNNKVYIGSSNNILFRWEQHKILLRANRHYNPRLQKAWDTYGERSFQFKIIKRTTLKKLLKVEQYYIDKFESYKPKNGYNISRIAGRASGWHHSEESRIKISKASKGRKASKKQIESSRLRFLGKKLFKVHVKNLKKAWKRRKARGDVPYWTGKKRSKKTNLKIAKKLKGRKIPKSIVRKWVKTRMENGYIHSEETKSKMSKSQTGKKISKKARLKSSISHKKYWAKVRRLKARGN
jgi:group I intron endonuclease